MNSTINCYYKDLSVSPWGLTIISAQRGTCTIIKVKCCVYIPDLSGNVSAALDDMKNQVKAT